MLIIKSLILASATLLATASASAIAVPADAVDTPLVERQAEGTAQGFSGNYCDGDAGNVIPCDLSCHQFYGRHSIRTSELVSIYYYTDTACSQPEGGEGPYYVDSSTGCANVNTGGPVLSFACGGETG